MTRSIAVNSPLVMLLAACQPAGDGSGAAPEPRLTTTSEDDQPGIAAMPPPGEYRLAGADGSEVNLGHAITVSIGEDTIAMVSQCVTPQWRYDYADGVLTTRIIPTPICERGRYPEEEAVMAVFDAPETALRTPDNGWYIAGGDHSVTLFSQ